MACLIHCYHAQKVSTAKIILYFIQFQLTYFQWICDHFVSSDNQPSCFHLMLPSTLPDNNPFLCVHCKMKMKVIPQLQVKSLQFTSKDSCVSFEN